MPSTHKYSFKEVVDKVSPPFEGGVAGTIDYLIFTRFIPRPGWLIHRYLFIFIPMNNINLFSRKDLKNSRVTLRNRSTSAEATLGDRIVFLDPGYFKSEIRKVLDENYE